VLRVVHRDVSLARRWPGSRFRYLGPIGRDTGTGRLYVKNPGVVEEPTRGRRASEEQEHLAPRFGKRVSGTGWGSGATDPQCGPSAPDRESLAADGQEQPQRQGRERLWPVVKRSTSMN